MNTCKITIRPCVEDGLISYLKITYEMDELVRKNESELCYADLSTVSISGAEPEHVIFTDEAGEIPYSTKDESPYPYVRRQYLAERDTKGPGTITYIVRPRILPPDAICGPYFDLRSEDGGINMSGLSFLMAMENYKGEMTLDWDLSELPEGSRGICTWGEGSVTMEAELEKFREAYYAVGEVKSVSEGSFGFYWLSPTNFDVQTLADYTKNLFGIMQKFFRDENPVYRIFVRKDPFTHSGGTALQRSYMFGWNEAEPVSVSSMQNILAHEMVHNWPSLNDNPYGISSWYAEGTAEFYSIMIPLRAGLITKETALEEIQKRTDAYYTNPTRHMENMEAARICWQDRRAQRLPYGRGIFFLANTDVKIRQATEGEKGIDDVVLAILEMDRKGEVLSNELFLKTVKEIAGIDVSEDHRMMCNGEHFAPLSDAFDGYFTAEEKEMPEADTGKTVVSYQWKLRK